MGIYRFLASLLLNLYAVTTRDRSGFTWVVEYIQPTINKVIITLVSDHHVPGNKLLWLDCRSKTVFREWEATTLVANMVLRPTKMVIFAALRGCILIQAIAIMHSEV